MAKARLQRIVGLPQKATEPETCAGRATSAGAATVPRAVFRFQRAALSREACGGPRHSLQLHVGEDSVARGGSGEEAQEARFASEATTTTAVTGNDAAYR